MSKFSSFAKTQSELGRVLGVSDRSIRDWQNSGMSCFHKGQGYLVPEAIAWAKQNRWQPSRGDVESDDRREIAELRKAEADAELRESKNRQQLASLVDRASVDAAIGELLDDLRARLATVTDEVCVEVPEQFRESVAFGFSNRLRLILTEVNAWQADRHGAIGGQADQQKEEVIDTTSEDGTERGVTKLLEGAGK